MTLPTSGDKKIATALAFTLLGLWLSSCSRTPASSLDGTWKYDRDLSEKSFRRDNKESGLKSQDIEPIGGDDATLAFDGGRATIDAPNLSITHSEFGYSVVSGDSQSVTISLKDPGSGATATDTFHFDGDDVMWTQNEKQIQLLPIGQARQYYHRQR